MLIQHLLRASPVPRRTLSSSSSSTLRLATLPRRHVLSVSGTEATKFLQGIITNDLERLHASSAKHIYAAFLNATGRVMQDVFIYLAPDSTADSPSYLVEHDASLTSALKSQIKRFILRAKVKVRDVSLEYSVSALFGESHVAGLEGAEDGRAPGMGWRLLEQQGKQPTIEADWQAVDERAYMLHRILNGVPEGPLDIAAGSAIPLESNIDYMGGIDFRKGCYVGQELTARTHHTGVTRKRIVPVRLFEGEDLPDTLLPSEWAQPVPVEGDDSLPQPHTDLRPEQSTTSRPRPAGKMGSSLFVRDSASSAPAVAVGLALLRLENLDSTTFSIAAPGEADVSSAGGLASTPSSTAWRVKAFPPIDGRGGQVAIKLFIPYDGDTRRCVIAWHLGSLSGAERPNRLSDLRSWALFAVLQHLRVYIFSRFRESSIPLARSARDMARTLQGPLYYISLVASLLSFPIAYRLAFDGKALVTEANLPWPGAGGEAFLAMAGVRNAALGAVTLATVLARERKASGIVLLAGPIISQLDNLVIYRYGHLGSDLLVISAVITFGLTLLGSLLLRGGEDKVKSR